MQRQNATLSDKIQLIALLVNIAVVIGLAIWNISQEERLSKLEYDELAPRIVIYRDVILDLEVNYAAYKWIIRNNGRTAAENIVVTVFTNPEFSFDDCILGVPFDNVQKRVSGNYMLFEGLVLSPQGTIYISCTTKPGSLMVFMDKYKVFPDTIPSLNCAQSVAYDINLRFLLPNLGVTANNLEPSRISCVQDIKDVYE